MNDARPLTAEEETRLRTAVAHGLVLNNENAPGLVASLLATLDVARAPRPDVAEVRQSIEDLPGMTAVGPDGRWHSWKAWDAVDGLLATLEAARLAAPPPDALVGAALTLFDPMDHGSPSKPNADHTVESLCRACVNVRSKRTNAIQRALIGLGAMPAIGLRADPPPDERPCSACGKVAGVCQCEDDGDRRGLYDDTDAAPPPDEREGLDALRRQVSMLPLWSPHPDIADRVGGRSARLVKESDVLALIDSGLARLRDAEQPARDSLTQRGIDEQERRHRARLRDAEQPAREERTR